MDSNQLSQLQNLVSMAEGTSDEKAREKGFASGYDVPFNYGQFLTPEKPLTQMTIGEVLDFGRRQVNSSKGRYGTRQMKSKRQGTSALGKYQINSPTLKGLVKKLNISENEKFSPEMQDRLFGEILKEIKVDSYLEGKTSKEEFQNKLSGRFASIPKSGKETGTYAGQPVGLSDSQVSATLESVVNQKDVAEQTEDMMNMQTAEKPVETAKDDDGDVMMRIGDFVKSLFERDEETPPAPAPRPVQDTDTQPPIQQKEETQAMLDESSPSIEGMVTPSPRPVDAAPIPQPRPGEPMDDFERAAADARSAGEENVVLDVDGNFRSETMEERMQREALDQQEGEPEQPKFNEGGSVEKEVNFVDDNESDEEPADPPPGATPEEVADDIPAYLSTGEYVLPANVVRYLGLERIVEMHKGALQQLQQMEDLDIIENVDENGMVEEDDDEMEYLDAPEGVVKTTLVIAKPHPSGMMAMPFAEGGEAKVYIPGVGYRDVLDPSYVSSNDTGAKDVEEPRVLENLESADEEDYGTKSLDEMTFEERTEFADQLQSPGLGGMLSRAGMNLAELAEKGLMGIAANVAGAKSEVGRQKEYLDQLANLTEEERQILSEENPDFIGNLTGLGIGLASRGLEDAESKAEDLDDYSNQAEQQEYSDEAGGVDTGDDEAESAAASGDVGAYKRGGYLSRKRGGIMAA
jgi:hypothetical protein